MRTRHLVFGGAVLLLLTLAPASATIITVPNVGYTGSTTLIPIVGADGSTLTALADGTETVTFSATMTEATVPAGGWATWGSPPNTETSTPRVLTDLSGSGLTVDLTLTTAEDTFGFEYEPNNTGPFSIQVQFLNGATVLDTDILSVSGASGALLFAATESTPITKVIITGAAGDGGFALANVRYGGSQSQNAAPEPATLALFPAGLAAMYFLLRRQRKA
jgi:hypothetical protein